MITSLVLASVLVQDRQDAQPISTGQVISPIGKHVDPGYFPCNMALSPDGRSLLVTTAGHREFLSVIDTKTGEIVGQQDFNGRTDDERQSLYFGIAWGPLSGDGRLVYAANGSMDSVTECKAMPDGSLAKPLRSIRTAPPAKEDALRAQAAGIALDSTGGKLLVVHNGTSAFTDFKGELVVMDLKTGQREAQISTAGFPLDVKLLTKGPQRDRKAYVTSERDGVVQVVSLTEGRVVRDIKTGSEPTHLMLNRDQTRLFVANSGGDTVTIIDTRSSRVLATILVRPDAVRGFPGTTPLGMALSPDEKTLFVACADINAVAVIEVATRELEGYIPTGWYPTSVAVSPDGARLFVASAKGIESLNPNNVPDSSNERHPLRVMQGTVSMMPVPSRKALAAMTEKVVANNRFAELARFAELYKTYNPGIEHCIYVVKENRTYDQVLGDYEKGNGDPEICLFPKEVTPNQHALAERFALLDNFYVCAEVSADGWSWSVAGMANEYNQRNSRYNYAGRGREYDFEGQNNGTAVDLLGLRDVSEPDGGYIWDAAAKAGKTYRNYGMYTAFGDATVTPQGTPVSEDNKPTKRALLEHTDLNYRRYDLAYAESPAWHEYANPSQNQLKEFGGFKSRFEAWKAEFDEFVKNGKLPALSLVRMGNDHTAGTRAGGFSPRAMVADNDYAVGLLVEAVSKSPYWTKTAIFVIEDDAQAGYDHVDCHRSICFVVSPYVPRGTHDSRFYNTDSVLHSISALLGMKPWNQLVAIAEPFRFFAKTPDNAETFTAIKPAKEIIGEINQPDAYRSADSARLISRFQEESLPDIELKDILWGAIKGAKTPRPPVRRNVQLNEQDDD
ncbi:MAG: hypothetical protein KIT11_11605 [Fimbriimonadaceae bacterium]|nr:hypothetical protein [Fimbriimonadaceae bacterium]QYK55321.1 MAG: hypothetical protein KF733_09930 [Fimbriimonadaceae bacterium]